MTEVGVEDQQDALAELAAMDRESLARRWAVVLGCPAPRHSPAGLLRRALAWHYQMARETSGKAGGVDRLIRSVRRATASVTSTPAVAPGTRLLREWRGYTHHVTVLAAGYEYNGKSYRSLTAIARQITGTAWSGPVFFGLRP
jgi:hypothetical protein